MPVPAVETGSAPRLKPSLRGSWGSVTLSGRQIPVRAIVVVAGVIGWLGLMLLHSGGAGIAAIWVSALFLVPLVAIGSFTRSVSLARAA